MRYVVRVVPAGDYKTEIFRGEFAGHFYLKSEWTDGDKRSWNNLTRFETVRQFRETRLLTADEMSFIYITLGQGHRELYTSE